MAQTVLTFITKVDPGKVTQLTTLLDRIDIHQSSKPLITFASLKQLHFASFVIFDDGDYGPDLVFENNFDGSLDAYLEDLLRHAGHGLHEIYRCCLGYTATALYDQQQMTAYLRAHVVWPNAYHIGNVGRGAERIHQETILRDRLEVFLDDLVTDAKADEPLGSLRRHIQQFVGDDPSLTWATNVRPRQTIIERLMPWAKIALVAMCALLISPVLIPLAIVWLVVLRRHEKLDPDQFRPVSSAHVQLLAQREDRIVQNHYAGIFHVKPGWFRRVTLRSVLWIANLIARTSTRGKLMGIPSIHFAHWSLIDDGRRLLFLSNYGGSWGNYLDDFIDKASTGLTGIWSNTTDFPPTRFLVLDGSRNGPRFKSFARSKQFATRVWYSAYPDLTVQNIDHNSAIREDLFTQLDETAMRTWLRRF
ncbi:MAG: hypothetical protein M3458_18200 [Acidobacteriota bacterium]|nr:hypothetical protein [Acidobacteriota bacterium]